MANDIDSRGNKGPVSRININNITMLNGGVIDAGIPTADLVVVFNTVKLKLAASQVCPPVTINDIQRYIYRSKCGTGPKYGNRPDCFFGKNAW